MLAEFLREAGLLIAVFVPLDVFFSNRPVRAAMVMLGLGISAAFLVAGIALERTRR